MKKLLAAGLFAVLALTFQPQAEALKIFGLGTKDYDVVLIAVPVTVQEIKWNSGIDAVDGDINDGVKRDLVTFQIERVAVGELSKVARGGLSKWEQLKESKTAAFSLKDPSELVDRERIRIAHSKTGEAFGITPGQPLPSYQYKIYLKRVSRNPESFLFVRAEPLK